MSMYDEMKKKYDEIQSYKILDTVELTGTIVCTGAPGSGKSTYAQDNAGQFDMVYDFDLIERAISKAQNKDDRPVWSYQLIKTIKGVMLAYKLPPALWLVGTMPSAYEKEYYAKKYSAIIYVLDPGIEVCKQRVMDDDDRKDKTLWLGLIDKYYKEYEPYKDEIVINK